MSWPPESWAQSAQVVTPPVDAPPHSVADDQNGLLAKAGEPETHADAIHWMLGMPAFKAQCDPAGAQSVSARETPELQLARLGVALVRYAG